MKEEMEKREFDVIVIGAGHAGLEAALAASRMGCSTAIVTGNVATIGHMSCNPAIGGLAKGQLVREIDALGGEMGIAADLSGIHWKRLNATRGPAVRGTRCQSDRSSYMAHMQRVVKNQGNLSLVEAKAEDILVEDYRIKGLSTSMGDLFCQKLVITTGTFLNGLMHVGMSHQDGGRLNDFVARSLSESLRGLGFELGRLKTGTCPRLDAGSLDFSRMEIQHGDEAAPFFSFRPTSHPLPQRPCYITHTNERAHQLIRDAKELSPMYSGKIKGVGPRYCPSIEDKVMRFPEKHSHQLFVEPEGLDRDEMYINGLSTSLPLEVQLQVVRQIIGMEEAIINKPGYAVEYDFVNPIQLYATLESKRIEGLFCAGQINGTSGYEEAAAQGIVAGINAALALQGRGPLVLKRSEAYIGVLIDDLITKGTEEPYRMFTSRAEYRLLLREDNADLRLSQLGYEIGLLDSEQYQRFSFKRQEIDTLSRRLRQNIVTPMASSHERLKTLNTQPLKKGLSCESLVRRPELAIRDVMRTFCPEGIEPYRPEVLEQVEIQVKYEGYIQAQLDEIAKSGHVERMSIPEQFPFLEVPSLSTEIRLKLDRVRPANLAQAARISGVTPAAISILALFIKKWSKMGRVATP